MTSIAETTEGRERNSPGIPPSILAQASAAHAAAERAAAEAAAASDREARRQQEEALAPFRSEVSFRLGGLAGQLPIKWGAFGSPSDLRCFVEIAVGIAGIVRVSTGPRYGVSLNVSGHRSSEDEDDDRYAMCFEDSVLPDENLRDVVLRAVHAIVTAGPLPRRTQAKPALPEPKLPDDGGPAYFPPPNGQYGGLSVRDHLAAAVLPAVYAEDKNDGTTSYFEEVVTVAYSIADLMLVERRKPLVAAPGQPARMVGVPATDDSGGGAPGGEEEDPEPFDGLS